MYNVVVSYVRTMDVVVFVSTLELSMKISKETNSTREPTENHVRVNCADFE